MKKISKIVSAFVCLAMAVGVGVAIGSTGRDAEGVSAGDVTDEITASDLAATGTTYTDFSNVAITSDARYAGNSAKNSSGSIQLRSKNSNSGIVSTTSGGTVKSVTITVGSGTNTIDVYGSTSAYSAASDLYGSSQGTKVGSVSETGTINFTGDNANFTFVGIRSNNGAIYLSSVEIVWDEGGDTPTEDPYITVDSTLSGFTGGHVDLAYTAGNLDSGLVVESGDTSKVTVGTPTSTTADGTVQVNFLQPTTSAVKLSFKDGTTELAACNVSVTQTTLTLNTNAMSIGQGKSGTLTATHNASSLGGVNWSVSGNDKVSVDNGVVSVAADAVVNSTATITATSQVDSSVSASCTVTVVVPPQSYDIVFTTDASCSDTSTAISWSVYTIPTGVTFDNTVNFVYGGTGKNVKLNKGSGSGSSFDVTIPSTRKVTTVTISACYWNNDTTAQLQIIPDGGDAVSASSGSLASGTFSDLVYNISSSEVNKFTVSAPVGGKRVFIAAMSIEYASLPQLDSVTSSEWTTSFDYGDGFAYDGTLTAHYTQSKADATVTPSAFKYGASDIDPAEAGTTIEEGDTLTDTTHNGKYIYIGYTEDTITKWTSGYQISVGPAPSYYINLSISSDTGSAYGYKGGTVTVSVTSSHLVGNIDWSVTAGSVTGATSSNSGYSATIASVGTLTIKATDLGDSTNNQSVSITVVDSLKAVMAPATTKSASTLNFTKACGGSGTSDDSATWTITSDAAESTFDSTRGIHYGTNSSQTVQYLQLVSEDVASGANKKIKSVVVNATDAANKGALTVSVGSSSFHCAGNESVAVTSTQSNYTFSGSATGTVTVLIDRGEAAYKGIYVKSIVVNYVTEGATSNIANATNMHLAQKAVIDYAKAFNDSLSAICVAYGETDEGDLSDAWSALVTQYDNWFNKGGKSLSSDEIAHAKALFANADSVDREDDPTADELQHMLAKYDEILSHYDLADFLNTDEGTGRDAVNGLAARVEAFGFDSTTAISIIVIISIISVTSIGALLVLRRRKEN